MYANYTVSLAIGALVFFILLFLGVGYAFVQLRDPESTLSRKYKSRIPTVLPFLRFFLPILMLFLVFEIVFTMTALLSNT